MNRRRALALCGAVVCACRVLSAQPPPRPITVVLTGQSMIRSDLRATKPSAVEAIKLPFLNFREFVKFDCVAIALTLPLQLLSLYIRSHVSNQPGIAGIFNLPRAIISVPFSVAWIRLGVNGARAVAH